MGDIKKPPQFLGYEAQLAHLEKKGLLIPDKKQAETVIGQIGYYELINGYKALFKETDGKRYRAGVTLFDILALYKCDENLRELFFKYILRIEIHLRAVLSYTFTEKYGSRQNAYLDPAHYTDEPALRGEVRRLIGDLRSLAQRPSAAAYVRYYQEEYHNVPLWVLFKASSLGVLVRFFICCNKDITAATLRAFPELREKTMEKMLMLLNKFRNVCAHNDCLYAYRSPDSIPAMPVLRDVTFSQLRQEDGVYAGNDLFALYVVFSYFLSPADFEKCRAGLRQILEHFFTQCGSEDRERLYGVMGFPLDWERLKDKSFKERKIHL